MLSRFVSGSGPLDGDPVWVDIQGAALRAAYGDVYAISATVTAAEEPSRGLILSRPHLVKQLGAVAPTRYAELLSLVN